VNPDPDGKHCAELQKAIQLRLELEGPGQIQDIALFLDYMSLPQHGEKGDPAYPQRGAKRTELEDQAFSKGLKKVNIPYASQLTETWMMKWVKENDDRKYMTRGWPFFEQAVSGLIKGATQLIEVKPDVMQCNNWVEVHNMGKVGRKPPLIPARFAEELQEKTFTSGADRGFVCNKYKETFCEVVGSAKTMWFVGLGWNDADARTIAEAFPFAVELERLLLADNELTAVGARTLINASSDCPTLINMDFTNNAIARDDVEDLQKLWTSHLRPVDGLQHEVKRWLDRDNLGLPTRPAHIGSPSVDLTASVIGNAQAVEDPQETLEVGDWVTLKPSVPEPKHAWGKVERGDVGMVTEVRGDTLIVDFSHIKKNPDWMAHAPEMQRQAAPELDMDASRFLKAERAVSSEQRLLVLKEQPEAVNDLDGTWPSLNVSRLSL